MDAILYLLTTCDTCSAEITKLYHTLLSCTTVAATMQMSLHNIIENIEATHNN